MRTILFSGFLIGAFFLNNACAGEVRLTTYYPAPYGVYNKTVMRVLGVGDNNADGNITASDAPDPNDLNQTDSAWIANNLSVGPGFRTQPRARVQVGDGNVLLANPPLGIMINVPYYDSGLYFTDWARSIAFTNFNLTNNTSTWDDTILSIGIKGDAQVFRYGYIGGGNAQDISDHPWVTFFPNGDVGLNTTTQLAGSVNNLGGNLNVNDVWVRARAASGGSGRWVSQMGVTLRCAQSWPVSTLDITQYIAPLGSSAPISSYCDHNLTLDVPVAIDDIVKVTITGSIRGVLYTDIAILENSTSFQYVCPTPDGNLSQSAAVIDQRQVGVHWTAFSVTGVYRATANGTLKFRQHYFGNDMYAERTGKVAGRFATAEVFKQ